MKNKEAKVAVKVVAKTTGYGRLKVGKTYKVLSPYNDGSKYIFVLDETNDINGYHIRNFSNVSKRKKSIEKSEWDGKQVRVRSAGAGSDFMGGTWTVIYRLPSKGSSSLAIRKELRGKYLVMNDGGGSCMYVTEAELELA